ncbi:GNAT family N-acetyltransferase [Deltaproteobacteria bacterium]|nr:GNAT family N-acetyltransferase [Deltaproteobacteria bacterium]
MEISIRKMVQSDLPRVIEILAHWNMAPVAASPVNPTPERCNIPVENSFVALDGHRLVGTCSYILLSDEMAETASLAVDPRYRGKGIGYMLQKRRLKEMKKNGIKRVKTEADRPQTIRWYTSKFDYKIIGQNKKKHSFSLPEVEYWTVMELDLQDYDI